MRYKYRHHPSRMSTLMVIFGAGSRVEFGSKYPIGIAHFMEHMRFKGTNKYTAKDLLKKTADVGGSWNAFTSEDLVAYHMRIPEENIETAFECLSEIVRDPIFPQDEMGKEQEVVCQEVRMYDDDINSLVHDKLMNVAFNNSLTLPVVGTEESVKSITRQHLIDFNKEFYSNEHMMIMLASTADHSDLAEKYFGIADDVWIYKPAADKVDYLPAAQEKVFKEGQLQNSIAVGFGNEDLMRSAKNLQHVHSVFNNIFGSGDTSRLFMSVREDLGLVYGIGASLNYSLDGTIYEIWTSTEPENSEKVINEIDRQIEIMLASPPSEEELSRAKNKIKSAMYSRLDTSNGAVSEIINEEFYGGKSGSEFIAQVESVTAEEVHNIAKLIFGGTKHTIVGTGK